MQFSVRYYKNKLKEKFFEFVQDAHREASNTAYKCYVMRGSIIIAEYADGHQVNTEADGQYKDHVARYGRRMPNFGNPYQ